MGDIPVQLALTFILGACLLFPALQAMLVVLNRRLEQPGSIKLIKTFFVALKHNYFSSLKPSALFSLIWLILGLDYYVLNPLHPTIGWILMFIGIIFFVWTFTFFAEINMSDEDLKKQLITALKKTISRPKIVALYLMVNAIMGLLIILSAWFLIPFFIVSVNGIIALKVNQVSRSLIIEE